MGWEIYVYQPCAWWDVPEMGHIMLMAAAVIEQSLRVPSLLVYPGKMYVAKKKGHGSAFEGGACQ